MIAHVERRSLLVRRARGLRLRELFEKTTEQEPRLGADRFAPKELPQLARRLGGLAALVEVLEPALADAPLARRDLDGLAEQVRGVAPGLEVFENARVWSRSACSSGVGCTLSNAA